MIRICLVFWKSEPRYAYKRYACKKKHVIEWSLVLKLICYRIIIIEEEKRERVVI